MLQKTLKDNGVLLLFDNVKFDLIFCGQNDRKNFFRELSVLERKVIQLPDNFPFLVQIDFKFGKSVVWNIPDPFKQEGKVVGCHCEPYKIVFQ